MPFQERALEENMRKFRHKQYYKRNIASHTSLFLLLHAATISLAQADSKIFSDTPASDECKTQAKNYLDEKKPTRISDHCFGDYLASAAPNAVRKSEDGQTLAFGHKNILFIQTTSPTSSSTETTAKIEKHIIAGKHSSLREITALTLDNSNRDVIVLDGAHGIALPFSLKYFGNVSPRRTLKSTLLKGATSIAVDPIHDELIFSNNSNQSILFFSRLADIDGHKSNSSITQLRSIEGSLTQITSSQSLAIDLEHDEIFLLDREANQILVFDRAISGNIAPKRVVRGNATLLSSPVTLTYNKSNDTLEILNGNGDPLSFPRTATGDSPPLKLPLHP
jgi:hypothetical protein